MASAQAERYLASLPPEDQQAIRAGGDVDAWFNAAVQAGAVPQQYAPYGQGANTASQDWANMTAQQAGINPWQQDYKQEFATTDAAALARMSPEQRARWSMEHLDALDYRTRDSSFAQWMAWQRSFDPSCPSSAPYQAEDGSGCVEKPDNSNRGYQEAQAGGGGGGQGGRGAGQNGQQSLTSPLVDMLKNQGSFLGGYDPTRGDGNPGIRGGVVGGGGIWWQPTAQPLVANAPNSPIPPTGPKSETGGGTRLPSSGACPDGSTPRSVPCLNPPCPQQCSDGSAPRGGEVRGSGGLGPYGGVTGGQGAPRTGGVTGRGTAPAVQFAPRQDALTAAMTPLQGQQPFSGTTLGGTMAQSPWMRPKRQQAGLAGAISPFQRTGRAPGSWF